jgi:hypothetical protein
MTDLQDQDVHDTTGLADEITAEEKAMFEGGTQEAAEPAVEEPAAPVDTEPKEPAAEEPAAGEEEDNDGEEVLEQNGGRFIRHGAFHRERKLRQAAEKQMAEFQERIAREQSERARIDERLRILMEASQPQPQPGQPGAQGEQPKVPNPEEDPFAYMRYLEDRLNAVTQQNQQVGETVQEEREHAALKTAFMTDAQRYAQQTPDFMSAYQHLMTARDRELSRLGMDNPHERADIIQREERQIVAECFRRGKSPSELIYDLAKDRGYAKPAPAPAAAPAAEAPAVTTAKPSAIAQVAAIKRGTEASKSLGSAAGGGTTPVTAESLAAMDEEEFHRVVSGMSREQKRQYFGG